MPASWSWGTLTVVACLISSFQRPRLLALIAPTTLLLSALLWMPGGQMLWYAFENFWLAGVLAACSLMLAGRALVLGEASWSGRSPRSRESSGRR